MAANEWGIDDDLDPRSFEAAVQWEAVREAERVVERAMDGPGPVSSLLAHLREDEDEA